MSLGPTLVGGVIGAAVGVGLHLIVELTTGFEAPWFAIVIGLMTGLGVHQANKSLDGNVSYLRGAITAAIALGAIVGSTPLISKLVSPRTAVASDSKTAAASKDAEAEDDAGEGSAAASDGAEDDATESDSREGDRTGSGVGVGQPGRGTTPFNVFQFIYMAVGTFIAYEFGRGTGKSVAVPSSPVDEPIAMDPSN
jgi:hypothetical protein